MEPEKLEELLNSGNLDGALAVVGEHKEIWWEFNCQLRVDLLVNFLGDTYPNP